MSDVFNAVKKLHRDHVLREEHVDQGLAQQASRLDEIVKEIRWLGDCVEEQAIRVAQLEQEGEVAPSRPGAGGAQFGEEELQQDVLEQLSSLEAAIEELKQDVVKVHFAQGVGQALLRAMERGLEEMRSARAASEEAQEQEVGAGSALKAHLCSQAADEGAPLPVRSSAAHLGAEDQRLGYLAQRDLSAAKAVSRRHARVLGHSAPRQASDSEPSPRADASHPEPRPQRRRYGRIGFGCGMSPYDRAW